MKAFSSLLLMAIGLWLLPSISLADTQYSCDQQTDISTSQCQNLVDLYQSTQGELWSQNLQQPWLSSANPCDWQGVICWGNRVARIELINSGLKGKLPSLADLPHLTYLALVGNPELSGPLPDLSQHQAMTQLLIFNNGLQGFLPDFSQMPKLKQVVMFNNQFIGPIPSTETLEKLVIFGNQLCLSPQLNYQNWQSSVASYTHCQPMLVNDLQGKLDLAEFGVIASDGKDDAHAINHIINMLQLSLPATAKLANMELHFPKGQLDIARDIQLKNFEDFSFYADTSTGHQSSLVKMPSFTNNQNQLNDHRQNAIINASFGSGLRVEGLKFQGSLTDLNTPYLWWDTGLYIGSSQQTHIHNNQFYHFGDAALLISNDRDDNNPGINSSDTEVNNNYFYNITQTSTTSVTGGSKQYRFINNRVEHLKGAIKFASRRQGASDLLIKDNYIRSAGVGKGINTNNGIEIEGYSDINIRHNDLADGQGVGIVIRSMQNANIPQVWDWGNVTIDNNQIAQYRQAIYLSNLPHLSLGLTPNASHFVIRNNQIKQIWNADKQAMIHFVGQQFAEAEASFNQFTGGTYTIWPGPTQWLKLEGNTLLP